MQIGRPGDAGGLQDGRAKTAASAARAAFGETALQQAVAGEPINRKKNDRKIMARRQGPRLLCSMNL